MDGVRGDWRRTAARMAALAAAMGLGIIALPAAVYAQAAPINVELSEFTIKASATSAAAGTVNFAAKNVGANNHELVIVRSSGAPTSLPLNATNGVDEAQVQIVKRMDRIAGGASGTLSADLTAGSYILICNVGTHYQRGMNIAFTVGGAGAASGAVGAPKSGSGGYLGGGGSGLTQLAFGGLALAAAAAALGVGLRPRRER